MKAWVLRGINDIKLESAPKPVPKGGEVLVRVVAAGVCSSDIQRVYHTGAYHYPIILGHEFSGVTEDNRSVAVFPLVPCKTCEQCEKGRFETCLDYGYLGSRQDGAFAEYVAVPEWNLLELPGGVTFEQAALLEPAAVALHAVRRLNLSGVRSAAVVGDGAIGRLIARWLTLCGVGAAHLLGAGGEARFARYDACFEAAGGEGALRRCVELVRPNGQIALVGNPNTDFKIEQKLYWQILRKQLTVCGSWNSSWRADWSFALERVNELRLNDIIARRFAFGELGGALEFARLKRGKAIVRVSGAP